MDFPVIDLFAGAGGLGVGVKKAGGDLRLSVEVDLQACKSMESNPEYHTGKVLCEDVRNLNGGSLLEIAEIKPGTPFLIAGGPPCQPFSKASYWTDKGDDSRYRRARANGVQLAKPKAITEAKPDERRSLIFEFFRLINESKPSGFLFENVPSILHPRNIATFNEFRSSLEAIGYRTRLVKANGLDFGLAQKRKRIILLGFQNELPSEPIFSYSDKLNEIAEGKLPYQNVQDAISAYSDEKYFEPEEVVSGKWAEHLMEIPPGMNYKALTEWAGHPNPSFIAESRFWNFLLKLHPERPSWTLAASPGPWTGPFHWESRRLRTIEMGILQGFPSEYRFVGSRRTRVKQIGNALPSNIASGCLAPILEILNGNKKNRS